MVAGWAYWEQEREIARIMLHQRPRAAGRP
jgi:hypothetical protein